MSAELMGAVWKLDLSHPKQSIMLALADHAHDDGTNCYPGVPYLAWKTGYSERNVTRILGELEYDGLIEAQDQKTGGFGVYTEYHIHLEKGDKKAPFSKKSKRKRVTSRTPKGDNSDANPDNSDKKGDNSPRANRDEPSSNRQEPSVEGSEAQPAREFEAPPDDATSRCLLLLSSVAGFPRDDSTNARKIAEYREQFPNADPVEVCEDFVAFISEKPFRRGDKPRLRLRNFFKQADKPRAASRASPGSSMSSNGAGRFESSSPERRQEGYEWLFD